MRWMERVKHMIRSWLEIQPAAGRGLTIQEPVSHATNVLRNRVWYRGDASELDQLFKLLGDDAVGQARFWAAAPQNETIRKAHSGLPGIMVDTLAGVVKSDLSDLDFDKNQEAAARWQRIAEENRLPDLVSQAVADTLVTGDGAFKISLDTQVSAGPILEFWGADRVEYVRRHGRICAVHFLSPIGDRGRMLKEIYEPGSVRYALLDADKEIPLDGQEEYADLKPVTFDGDFLLAVPLQFWPSARWNGRGQSIFDKKTDAFDAHDEIISQWLDAVRAGRVQKYIPESLIPRGEDGTLRNVNSFGTQFVKLETDNRGKRGKPDRHRAAGDPLRSLCGKLYLHSQYVPAGDNEPGHPGHRCGQDEQCRSAAGKEGCYRYDPERDHRRTGSCSSSAGPGGAGGCGHPGGQSPRRV